MYERHLHVKITRNFRPAGDYLLPANGKLSEAIEATDMHSAVKAALQEQNALKHSTFLSSHFYVSLPDPTFSPESCFDVRVELL